MWLIWFSSFVTRKAINSNADVCYMYSCHLVLCRYWKLRMIHVKFWIVKHVLWKPERTRPLSACHLANGKRLSCNEHSRYAATADSSVYFYKAAQIQVLFLSRSRHLASSACSGRSYCLPVASPRLSNLTPYVPFCKRVTEGCFCREMISGVWELWRWYGIICDCILKYSCKAFLMSPYASLQFFSFCLLDCQITPRSQMAVTISVLS